MWMKPKYPIYIPSKGRWASCPTVQRLDEMGLTYFVVVESEEAEFYAREIGPSRLLVLPFSNLGQGSIPARNWIWDHAVANDRPRHWVIDDNIRRFYRVNFNRRIPVATGTIFRCVEDFVDRYENVGLAGLNNIAFVPDRQPSITPITWNTRIYSMTLIDSGLKHRWRGRYNEDTDLSLRVLKDGDVTVQFNAFCGDKATTLTMRGGNTDTIYNTGDHRLEFAESLQRQHPDVVSVVWKFGRWHHEVDYGPFKRNAPRLRPGVVATGAPDEYGMTLKRVEATA